MHFMPDRRSEDHLMNYCRECCEGGSAAPQLPRRPGRPPRAAALYPLTQKACLSNLHQPSHHAICHNPEFLRIICREMF